VAALSRPGLARSLVFVVFAGLLVYCLTLAAGGWGIVATPEFAAALGIALAVNLALAGAAWALGAVDGAGAAVGALLGTAIWAFGGARAFGLLFAFVALGSGATRLGYESKARAGIAQEKGGRRGPGNALSKISVPALAAVFAATTGEPELFRLALAGALATAAADTVSSEIGKAYGRRTFLITTLRPVARGTDGAVSWEGSLAGAAAGLLVAGLGLALGLYPAAGAIAVAAAALAATTLESWAGATLEPRGLLDNEEVNFLDSLAGALLAVGFGVLPS
jgi:uncharacterized protein (TIGR00297 family)